MVYNGIGREQLFSLLSVWQLLLTVLFGPPTPHQVHRRPGQRRSIWQRWSATCTCRAGTEAAWRCATLIRDESYVIVPCSKRRSGLLGTSFEEVKRCFEEVRF